MPKRRHRELKKEERTDGWSRGTVNKIYIAVASMPPWLMAVSNRPKF